jgi:hypothetical protein
MPCHRANDTAFNQLMKNIELIPVFGTSFAVYIPLIMILMALLTLFDGYGRLVKVSLVPKAPRLVPPRRCLYCDDALLSFFFVEWTNSLHD